MIECVTPLAAASNPLTSHPLAVQCEDDNDKHQPLISTCTAKEFNNASAAKLWDLTSPPLRSVGGVVVLAQRSYVPDLAFIAVPHPDPGRIARIVIVHEQLSGLFVGNPFLQRQSEHIS